MGFKNFFGVARYFRKLGIDVETENFSLNDIPPSHELITFFGTYIGILNDISKKIKRPKKPLNVFIYTI